MELRDYQQVEGIHSRRVGQRRQEDASGAPYGMRKTIVFSKVEDRVILGERVLVLAHRASAGSGDRQAGEVNRIEMRYGESRADIDRRLPGCCRQTLMRDNGAAIPKSF